VPKHFLYRPIAILFAVYWLLPAAHAALQVEDPLDRIVAVVNDDVITQLALDAEVEIIKGQMARQGTRLPPDAVLRKQLLNRMILRRIQLQLAERVHLRVDDETLNRTLDNIAAQNQLSPEQFRQALAQQNIDYARFRQNMREEIIINRLQKRQVNNRIVVTTQEIDAFLANQRLKTGADVEYRLSHILISIPEAASATQIAEARARAEKAVGELRAGADFAQMAIAISDAQQALEGGDLGWRRSDALPTLFSDWVTSHAVNDVSDPIRSPSGFHIIKLQEQREHSEQHVVRQTRARHILLRKDEFTTSEELLAKLRQIRQRALAGEDFATLAKEFSEDPGSGADGGNLGWVSPGEMVPDFEAAMNQLAVGDISEPVRTRFGWHLIQVQERREHDATEEVLRNRARKTISARKLEPALENWLRQIRDQAFVETRL